MVVTIDPFMIIPLIFGVPFFAIGIYALLKSIATDKEFKENGIPVTAKIHDVRITWRNRSLHHGRSTLNVEADVIFHTKNNEEIITKADFASTTMKVGQEIPIMYLKDNPRKIRINTKGNTIATYALSGGFMVLGLAIIIVVLIGMFSQG